MTNGLLAEGVRSEDRTKLDGAPAKMRTAWTTSGGCTPTNAGHSQDVPASAPPGTSGNGDGAGSYPVQVLTSAHELPRAPPAAHGSSPPSTSRARGRVAALDGLRGLALVAVLAYHVAPSTVPGGFLGVESFFVLSGFLVTSLLLYESRHTGAIDRSAYAWRRLRRIAPALLVLLATLVVIVPFVAPEDVHRLRGDVTSSLTGTTNWHLIADQSSYFQRLGRPSFVRHLWSVAVEVQFYVLCPFLVACLARRRRGAAVAVLAAGVGLSAAVMALAYDRGDPSRAYYGTDARIGALLAGALLAVVVAGREGRETTGRGGRRFLVVAGPVALAVLVALFVLSDDRARSSYPFVFLATQAVTAIVVAASLRRGPLAAFLGRPALRWLGVRSYGIYLWHWPAVVLFRPGVDVAWPPVVAAGATVAVALLLGSLSYRYVERPAWGPAGPARHRSTATVASTALVATVGVAGFIGLLVQLPSVNPLAETLRAGQRVLAAQAPAGTAPPMPSTTPTAATPAHPSTSAVPTLAPAPAPPADVAPATAPPPPLPPPRLSPPQLGTVSVTAIGDSVMVSAAGSLRDRLGVSGYIDAQNNRQFRDAVAIARRMKEEGRLTSVVAVHLGNNGPVKAGEVDALMGELAGVPHVLMVNLRVDAPWQDSVNQALADAAGRHAGITVVDWNGYSEGHPDWFQSDGTHFRTTSGPGAEAYADLLAGPISSQSPPTTTAAPPTTGAPETTTTTTSPPPVLTPLG